MGDVATWQSLAQQLRVDSVRVAAQASSGHPTSSMSAADLASVLLSDYLRYDMERRDAPNNDHLVFSKGHASPLIYSMLKAAGAIEEEEFLTYRSHGSRLEGHPIPNMPTVDVATGSLGQGLPISVGIALAGKRLDKLPYRVWVFCGDSEMAEAPCGRPPSTPPSGSSTTLPPSLTSTVSASVVRPCTAGTPAPMPPASRHSAGTPSRSMATMWTQSTPPIKRQ